MKVDIATKEDLLTFKAEMLEEISKMIRESKPLPIEDKKKWLKSHQVQRLLGISPGTLQNLRINGTIPYTKIGGIILYNPDDLEQVIQRNQRNKPFTK